MMYLKIFLVLFVVELNLSAVAQLRVATFDVNATPPLGSPVAYANTRSITDSLHAKGLVILLEDKPIVLCAVDWIGISNEGLDRWRQQLAAAAGTTIDRVAVHALHQHDAPRCDFTIEKIMEEYGSGGISIDDRFVTDVILRVGGAVQRAIHNAMPVTAITHGKFLVDSVASNRRLINGAGEIYTRYSKSTDLAMQNAPDGLIDPWMRCIGFWNNNRPIAAITFYTTHPQSYYGDGDVTCEFIGLARNEFEKEIGAPVIHFNGASGNIAAGKYNNGTQKAREQLTRRVREGMKGAWQQSLKNREKPEVVQWRNTEIKLPLGKNIQEEDLRQRLADTSLNIHMKFRAAEKLAWYQRSIAGVKINVTALRLNNTWILSIPGEAFVEYQLAAQQMVPGSFVCTAAYGDYGPGYIGTQKSYIEKGGYETSDIVSGTAPEVEEVLLKAIETVLSK
ncbi:MAG: hypothetical protein ACTHLE_22410 [Agriterribacter sp.]